MSAPGIGILESIPSFMIIYDAISGFVIGLGLIMAVGAQNVFVLQHGLKRSHLFTVCLTCALSDALLISFGVWGFHLVEDSATWSKSILLVAGAAFLFLYGVFSARRAIWPDDSRKLSGGASITWRKAFLACLAFTWLNPHVYLDTVVLLGTVSTQYESSAAFAAGAIIASFAFFFSLGYGARRLSHLFESQFAWRVLDTIVAIVMWALAFNLLLNP